MIQHGELHGKEEARDVRRRDRHSRAGIGDRALSVSDTVLHFFYNAIAYTATVIPFWFVAKARSKTRPS